MCNKAQAHSFIISDDHSRVVLQSSKNGDYINANYIKVCWLFI